MFNFMRLPPLRRLMLMKAITGGGSWSTVTGNPVSFTAKAAPLRKLEVAFSPVQDLHGYDSPWPAGGGKNLIRGYIPLALAVGDNGVYLGGNHGTIEGTTLYFPCKAGTTYVRSSTTGDTSNRLYWAAYDHLPVGGDFSADAQGAGATFTPQADGWCCLYIKNTVDDTLINYWMVEVGSTATSFVPYSNECPILGWDSLNVEQRGKNVWDEEWEQGGYDENSGVEISAGNISTQRSKNGISVKPSTAYYFKCDTTIATNPSVMVCEYDASGNYLGCFYKYAWEFAFTTKATTALMKFRVYNTNIPTIGGAGNLSINYPSTDHDYHPYNPLSRSISISLGSTVYGGTVDVISGVGTVTHKAVDMGTLTWVFHAYGDFSGGYSNSLIGTAKANDANLAPNSVCSALAPIADVYFDYRNTGTNFCINSYATLKVTIPNVTDSETLKSALSGVMLCYELATPIPIQLTPQEVQSLAGDNTMWTDAQNLEVTYRSN